MHHIQHQYIECETGRLCTEKRGLPFWVITMGCGDACPMVHAKCWDDWHIPDPQALPLDELRRVRDLIEAKVKELLTQW